MTDIETVDLAPENIAVYCVCGYKEVEKHLQLISKVYWFKEYYPKGLRIRSIISETDGLMELVL